MVMGWRAAPWHYEARYSRCHATWVYPPLRTLTRTHGPVRDLRRHRLTGSPRTRRDTRIGRCGLNPLACSPSFSAARRGRRKRIVRLGSRRAQLIAAAERACQINPAGWNHAAHPKPSMTTPAPSQSSRPAWPPLGPSPSSRCQKADPTTPGAVGGGGRGQIKG